MNINSLLILAIASGPGRSLEYIILRPQQEAVVKKGGGRTLVSGHIFMRLRYR